MPLYLEDLPPRGYSYRMAAVLTMIALDIEDKPINPGSAAELIRHFVALMIPAEHHGLLAIKGQPTWDKIESVKIHLGFASHDEQLDVLAQACEVVDLIYRHSTRPARKWKSDESVEVASFLRMLGYAKRAIVPRHAEVNGRVVDLLKFCKYCWRPAATAAMVCQFHSVQKRRNAVAAAQYKQAQRLQGSFEALVNRLGAVAELSFHDSEFTSQVFFPDLDANNWVMLNRPELHQALVDAGLAQWALADLCHYLYGDEAVAQQLLDRAQLLTPVTLRAEAWLSAMLAKPKWGGVRERRKSPEARKPKAVTRKDPAG